MNDTSAAADTSSHAAGAVDPSAVDPTAPRLPWPSLLVLGGSTFTMVTAEMLPTAVLPQMTAGLGVDEVRTGLLVSIWAAVVVIGSIPLVRLTRRFPRRAVIAWSLVALAASSALTAIAPAYEFVVGARVLGALAVGLLWATTNAHTADLVADRALARAIAVVLGGATLGMVLGTPIANLVAQAIGWRAAFGALAALTLVAAALVATVVRRGPRDASTDAAPSRVAPSPETSAVRPAMRPVLALIALVALVLVGHYGAYTYITRLVEDPAAALPGGMGTMLLVFGLASAAGVVVAGRYGELTGRALVVSAIATGASVAALAVVDVHAVVGTAVVIAWGVASGALPPLAQTMILRLAGPEGRDLASALIPVVFNLGIAIGAGAAAGLVGLVGVGAVPFAGAAVIGASAVGLGFAVRGPRRTATRAPRTGRSASVDP
ncbi:MFS transporter [Agromyces sp. LHK192]|uniref:MFS transporter n=1 Tax=Agromyces sp. LHK192 TaxID=2498704 RepID=UPI000FDA39CF|nr:MFS transporter [Agromyces sp. LHK192]